VKGGLMNKKILLICGTIGLAIGIILVIHANNVNDTFTANLTKLVGGTAPGHTEMICGVLISLVGVIVMVVGGLNKVE
jgi:hypothetical protein